ncbi:hypothetical protein GCM10011579_033160 [Streptomyces albiflavescens]|uniref:Uncharacterized protein n=1 Tax=Streptomyces albiflavescens TaxID=1623582 RepID=A0A917Y2H3_9ACTN|nr:hypothetical protein GCM10011579_033160 [Streptomyces albiflavescens]
MLSAVHTFRLPDFMMAEVPTFGAVVGAAAADLVELEALHAPRARAVRAAPVAIARCRLMVLLRAIHQSVDRMV